MKIKREHKIFSNQVFDVNSLHVVDDHGFEVSDYLVVEPKIHDKNLVSGVAVLPLVNSKIVCVEIYRPAFKTSMIEIPHGFIGKLETPEEACSRELREETGIEVDVSNFTYLFTMAPDTGVIRGLVKLFFANAEFPTENIINELGLGEVQYFDPAEIINLIDRGKIVDSFTISAFFASLSRGLIQNK